MAAISRLRARNLTRVGCTPWRQFGDQQLILGQRLKECGVSQVDRPRRHHWRGHRLLGRQRRVLLDARPRRCRRPHQRARSLPARRESAARSAAIPLPYAVAAREPTIAIERSMRWARCDGPRSQSPNGSPPRRWMDSACRRSSSPLGHSSSPGTTKRKSEALASPSTALVGTAAARCAAGSPRTPSVILAQAVSAPMFCTSSVTAGSPPSHSAGERRPGSPIRVDHDSDRLTFHSAWLLTTPHRQGDVQAVRPAPAHRGQRDLRSSKPIQERAQR